MLTLMFQPKYLLGSNYTKFNSIQKSVFDVTSGKILGLIISNRGIEIDPTKVKAILEMPTPSTLKQLRSLQRRLQSIRCFITQLANKCQPFQHLLKKGVTFKWIDQCQEAFQALKEYLLSTPVLISSTNSSLGALLVQQDDQEKEIAIYYINRTLIGYESQSSTHCTL